MTTSAPSAQGRGAESATRRKPADTRGLLSAALLPAFRAGTWIVAAAVRTVSDAVEPIALTTTAIAAAGLAGRRRMTVRARQALQAVVGVVVDAALEELDLTDILRQRVDLDAVITQVDLNAAATRLDVDRVVGRIDLDAVVERIDLDAVVGRIDVDAVAERLDLDRIADRLDLERQISRIDIDLIAQRVAIDVLAAQLDLDALAAGLNLDRLVERVDLDAVIARIDTVGLAREVVAKIDLPGIIRQSTGALSVEAVQGARSQSRNADDAVAGFVGRLFGQSGPPPQAG